MTEYIKLRKEDFRPHFRGRVCTEPVLSIKNNGLFVLNHLAVSLLKADKGGVSFCAEKSSRNCFAIMFDDSKEGYALRELKAKERCFNNVTLARHIIEATKQRIPLPAGSEYPSVFHFRIASKPVDDDKNSHIFALIYKK